MSDASTLLALSQEPLPATPFEFYYLSDDRPGYPTTYPVRMRFRGDLDRAAFEEATALALARHPMLTARIDSTGRWPRWVAAPPPSVRWFATNDTLGESNSTIEIDREAGLKISACVAASVSKVLFVFHHACADGLAAFQFIGEVLIAYDHLRRTNSGDPPWRQLDAGRLSRRAEYGLADYKPKLIDLVNTLRMWLPLVARRAAILDTRGDVAASQQSREPLGYITARLSSADARALGQLARSREVTVNDLLLRDLFLVVGEWNRASRQSRHPLRILVPTNLRLQEDEQMPAANVLSFAFLTRRRRDLGDSVQLLAGIRADTAAIKRWRLGLYFVGGLGIACNWPPLVRGFLNRRWPFATAVFSNVGAIFHDLPLPLEEGRLVCGGQVLETVDGVPPLRRDTRAAFALITYAGQLGVSLRCDPAHFTPERQRQLLDAFMNKVQSTIATGN